MDFWYTARNVYDKNYKDGLSWKRYLEWSKLTHLAEVISLDTMLNESLVETDRNNEADRDHIVNDNLSETGCFTDLNYVIKRVVSSTRFNLLAVVREPEKECNFIVIEDFEFVGYDLLDQYYDISALTNCGGFDETFSPSDINEYGLISEYRKAYEIKKELIKNNPGEHHADCNIMAIWRHKFIGRTKI